MSAKKQRIVSVVLGILVVGSAFFADVLRSRMFQSVRKIKDTHDVYPLPPPAYVRRMSLGYSDATISLLWASTLYQYGDHVARNRRFPFAIQYGQTIAALEPQFKPLYRYLSTFVTMQAIAPSLEELELTKQTLLLGVQARPFDPDTWGSLAAFLMFEGAQYFDKETQKQWRLEGAPLAQRAVELGYFMSTLNASGSEYLERFGHTDLAIAQLERAYVVATDDDARDQILAKLRKLKQEGLASKLSSFRKAVRARFLLEAPFASESLFSVIGPASKLPLGQVSWSTLAPPPVSR